MRATLSFALMACGGRAQEKDAADCPAGIPASLAPAPDQHLAFVRHATGVQRYACAVGQAGHVWSLVAPEAELFDRDGKQQGRHYAGPTWQDADGSTVVGAKRAAATVDATAIPWLLIDAVSHGATPGVMTAVTSVQRINTVGGLAPTSECAAAQSGATTDVPYSADYLFYETRTSPTLRNLRCGAR
ncbi:MAG TPA: DUF3455 domain-containing protein [Kofleriaceae bacterium]|nr:DUF3455 domain-containing protein [Kofleriaceae bacterium]